MWNSASGKQLTAGSRLFDRARVGGREVDVAAPHPVARLLADQLAQRGRLRVVDDRHVPPVAELAGVDLVVAPPRLPLLVGQVLRITLQRVVHHLGGVEELLAPVDHLPLHLDPDVGHQRHERVEDLRDPAAERGGGEMDDAEPLQPLGPLADLVHQRPPDDARVVGEVLVGDGDRLEHGGGGPQSYTARHGSRRESPVPARSAAVPPRRRPPQRAARGAPGSRR